MTRDEAMLARVAVLSLIGMGSANADPPPQACAGLASGLRDQLAEVRRLANPTAGTNIDVVIARSQGALREDFLQLKRSNEAFMRSQRDLAAAVEKAIGSLARCAASE
jgi:hypothetical protein